MAPLTFHVLLTCLLCLLRTGNGQPISGPTSIIVAPATLTLTPNASDTTGGQVTIQCRASSLYPGEDLLIAMNIQRVLDNDPNAAPTVVVGARSSQNQGNATLTLQSLQGATVTGGIGENSITLTMTRAKCADAGMYYCTATALDSNTALKYYESFKNVTIEVSPGSITMTIEPSGVNNWRVNDTLLMRCHSIVGTVQDESQLEWIWQYQDISGFPGLDIWQSYDGIGDPDNDIRTNTSVATTNPCYRRQTSELTRRLTVDDTGRQYRCYVINRDVSSQGTDQAQVYSVGTVTGPETLTTEVEPQDTESATVTSVSPSTVQTTETIQTTMTVTESTVRAGNDTDSGTNNHPDVLIVIGAVVAAVIVIYITPLSSPCFLK